MFVNEIYFMGFWLDLSIRISRVFYLFIYLFWIQEGNPSFSQNIAFFPFFHASLFLGCSQDWKQKIKVCLRESFTCDFLFKCVTTTTGVNSAHPNSLESADTKPLHVTRDANCQGEVVTGGKNTQGTRCKSNSKQTKKKWMFFLSPSLSFA